MEQKIVKIFERISKESLRGDESQNVNSQNVNIRNVEMSVIS